MTESGRGPHRSTYLPMSTSPEFLSLHPNARLVLWTLKHLSIGNVAGIFIFYREAVEVESGLSGKVLDAALAELKKTDWIRREARILWVRNQLRYDPFFSLADPNKRKMVERLISGLPKLGIVDSFAEYYGIDISGKSPETPDNMENPGTPEGTSGGASGETTEQSNKKKVLRESIKKGKNVDSGRVALVFNFWKSALDHPRAKLTPERSRRIRNILTAGYTVEEVAWSICGNGMSDFHQGGNDRSTVYDDIELITRNGTKLESFRKYIDEDTARKIYEDWKVTGEVTPEKFLKRGGGKR